MFFRNEGRLVLRRGEEEKQKYIENFIQTHNYTRPSRQKAEGGLMVNYVPE